MTRSQAAEIPTVLPVQARSRALVDAILEAAAQILERDGQARFTTNAVAARAGVSVGSLYRYFPNKTAILLALARDARAATEQRMTLALTDPSGLAPDRAAIRAFLQAFAGQRRTRQAAVTALLINDTKAAHGDSAALTGLLHDREGRPLPPLRATVLAQALLGAMRAAVLEDSDRLTMPAFEDELVALARAFANAPPAGRRYPAAVPPN
ncbi:MAG: hypothetical protein RL490_876 [Pseudomonadota bacterium]|jgi:AcrR family transcriptional regulator